EPGGPHVLGHHPANLERTGNLDEQGIDAGCVVADYHQRGSLVLRGDQLPPIHIKVVAPAGVETEAKVDKPADEARPRTALEPMTQQGPEGPGPEGERNPCGECHRAYVSVRKVFGNGKL